MKYPKCFVQNEMSLMCRKNKDSCVFELIHMPGAMLNNGLTVSHLVFTPVVGRYSYVLYKRIHWSSQSWYNILTIIQLVSERPLIFPKPVFFTTGFHCLSSSFFSNTAESFTWFSKRLLSAYCVPGLVLGRRYETM